MNVVDWTKVTEASNGDSDRLPAGGYICKITNVEDYDDKQYLKIEYEIVDGEFKGWGEKTAYNGWWKLNFIRSYKTTALGFFKHFLSALEKSTPGKFSASNLKDDPNVLRGLFIGLVVGSEQYRNKNDEIKERLYVADTIAGPDVRSGNYTVPELKVLKDDSPKFDSVGTQSNSSFTDDTLPF